MAALQLLRPVRLTLVQQMLLDYQYGANVLLLAKEYLPPGCAQALREKLALVFDLTQEFLRMVDRHLFPIDFNMVDEYLFRVWAPDEDEDEHPFDLAVSCIFPKLYGLTIDDYHQREVCLEKYPGMWLLYAAAGGREGLSVDLKEKVAEITGETIPSWPGYAAIEKRLEAWDVQEEPLCWVPELAYQALRTSGNFFLDSTWYDDGDDGYLMPGEFAWARADVNYLLSEWEAAQPELEKRRKFNAWCRSGENFKRLLWALGWRKKGEDEC